MLLPFQENIEKYYDAHIELWKSFETSPLKVGASVRITNV